MYLVGPFDIVFIDLNALNHIQIITIIVVYKFKDILLLKVII